MHPGDFDAGVEGVDLVTCRAETDVLQVIGEGFSRRNKFLFNCHVVGRIENVNTETSSTALLQCARDFW